MVGGALGIALPPTGWLGFTVAAALLVLAVGVVLWGRDRQRRLQRFGVALIDKLEVEMPLPGPRAQQATGAAVTVVRRDQDVAVLDAALNQGVPLYADRVAVWPPQIEHFGQVYGTFQVVRGRTDEAGGVPPIVLTGHPMQPDRGKVAGLRVQARSYATCWALTLLHVNITGTHCASAYDALGPGHPR